MITRHRRERLRENYKNSGLKINYYPPGELDILIQTDPKFRSDLSDAYQNYLNLKSIEPDVDTRFNEETYQIIRKYGADLHKKDAFFVTKSENDKNNMDAYLQSFKPIQRYKPWLGYETNQILSLAFMLKENPDASACVVFRDKSCRVEHKDYSCDMEWNNDGTGNLITTEKFDANLAGCLRNERKKIILISLTLHGTEVSKRSGREERWAHSNFIIIRKTGESPIAQHFEPHGMYRDFNDSGGLRYALTNYFNRFNVLYMRVEMTCPIGLQAIECDYKDRDCKDIKNDPGGYCAAWSLFFAQTALKFPHLLTSDITRLVAEVLNYDPKAFRKFIINYSQFLYKNIELLVTDEKVRELKPPPVKGERRSERGETVKATRKSLRKDYIERGGPPKQSMMKLPRNTENKAVEEFIQSHEQIE
jgi:hypothetical protein